MIHTEDLSEGGEGEKAVTVVGVCFRNSTKTYYFDPKELSLTTKDFAIVETARGLEFAKVTMPNRAVSPFTQFEVEMLPI